MEQRREIPRKLWWQTVAAPAGVAIAFTVIGWGNYVAYTVFGRGLMGRRDEDFFDRTPSYLYLALALTAVGLVGGAVVAAAHLGLVRRGIRVPGRLFGRGMGAYQGMTNVYVEYTVNGHRYEHAQTGSPELLKGFESGEPLTVYVDPRRPKRCLVLWTPFGE